VSKTSLADEVWTEGMKILTGLETANDVRAAIREDAPVLLNAFALKVILENFIFGRLSADALEHLATELEHDAVIYDRGQHALIATILFEIGTPEINRTFTHHRAREFLKLLSTA
jgi:hypothetical protein